MVVKVTKGQICSSTISKIECHKEYYCILCGRIKGFNRSITTIMREDGSYRTVVG